jgi:hypothetical protein
MALLQKLGHRRHLFLCPSNHIRITRWGARVTQRPEYHCFAIPHLTHGRAAPSLATCRIAPHVSIKGRAILKPLLLDPPSQSNMR